MTYGIGCLQVASSAVNCRINGIQMITVVADGIMGNSPEVMTIASEPLSRNVFVTPTLSGVLAASDGVLNAFCNGTRGIILFRANIIRFTQSVFCLTRVDVC